MQIDDVRRVLVVGAGTMGQQIALQCATHGYGVVLYDIDSSALEAGMARLRGFADEQVRAGLLDEAERALAAISATTNPVAAAADVDLLSESVPEDPALKGRVLGQFDVLCPARTVFTTNTSSLLPSMFAAATGRPDRFAALHFHPPVWSNTVADVMPHPGTSPETTELVLAFARRIGQIPIQLRRESYGYVFNAMYMALNEAAVTLAANGIASIEDVDRAWMGIMHMPIGPFGMLDGVGLDTAFDIADFWARQTGDRQRRVNADFYKAYVEQGRLGVKSGAGFYRYPNPAYAQPGFVSGETVPDAPGPGTPDPGSPADHGATAAAEPARGGSEDRAESGR